MKYLSTRLTLLALILLSGTAFAQEKIFSVTTNPGEDCSKQINISWASDTTLQGSYVLLTEETDAAWRKASKHLPEQEFVCRDFYGINSKDAANNDVVETAVFLKCGASINGLKKSTRYKYRIVASDGSESDVHHFLTAGQKEWKACIISDFHSYLPLPGRLTSAMGMIDTLADHAGGINWVLNLGDVTAWGGSYSFWQELYRQKPFHNYLWGGLIGNHDNMTKDYTYSHNYFLNATYNPRNGYESENGVVYYFTYGDALFIMLNSEDIGYNKNLKTAQDWVREVIKKHGKSKYIIVCQHWEWFLGHSNGQSSQYRHWRQFFDECGVDLALAGNNHVYMRTNALYNGAECTDGKKGTVYLQTAASDNGRGRNHPEKLTYNADKVKRMWSEGPHTISAVLLDANPKYLTLTLLDRNGNEIDQVKVKAKR